MLNIIVDNFSDKPLEILDMKVKRECTNKYRHEYVCIDIDTYKKYKVVFETSRMDLAIGRNNMYIYDNVDYCSFKMSETIIKENDNRELIKIELLDSDR